MIDAQAARAPASEPQSDETTDAPDVDREFTEFVRADSARLMRAAFLMTGDQHLAEDLVQDALARTYRSWRGRRVIDSPAAYTRKVMYHLQVSRWRRRRVAETLTDAAPTMPEPSRDVALEVAVRAALLKLTAAQRAVIVLRHFEDRTEADCAEILGIGKSTVHSRERRAAARLAELVPELNEEQS